MSEAVTVPRLMMMTLIVSEVSSVCRGYTDLTDTHTDRQTRLLALKIKQKAVKTGSCTLGTKSIIGKLDRKEFEKKKKETGQNLKS